MSPALAGKFFTTSATWEATQRWQQVKQVKKRMKGLVEEKRQTQDQCSDAPLGFGKITDAAG